MLHTSTVNQQRITYLCHTRAYMCRCAEGRLDGDLQAALGQASARAGESGGDIGFQPADKKAAKRAQAQTWDLQRGVSAAARAALTGQAAIPPET